GVSLADTRTVGYDLVTHDNQRVQVKTLKDGSRGRRYEVGRVRGPCDLLFMLRLARDYTPLAAIVIPFGVVEEVFGAGPVRWSLRFAADPRITTIEGEQLAFE